MYSLFLFETSRHISQSTQSEIADFLFTTNIIQDKSNQLVAGSNFFLHINFLGCSPTLMEEQNNSISLHFFSHSTALGGDSVVSIHCPNCKAKIPEPKRIIKDQAKNHTCSHCQKPFNAKTINWRKSAGISQKFIQIYNIFPKEALPNDAFIESLNQFTHSEWSYFYSKSFT